MAEPTYNLCDICGAQCNRACRLFIETGTHFDGLEHVRDGRHVDLCPKHQADLISFLLEGEQEMGANALKFIDQLAAATKKAK
jgi:hypothetical protein